MRGVIGGILGFATSVSLLAAEPAKPAKTAKASENAELKTAVGHLQHGRYDEALEAFDALKGDAEVLAARAVGKSRCLTAVGDDEAAEKLLAAALDDAPQSAELRAVLAELQLARGRWKECGETLAAAAKLDPELPRLKWVQAQLDVERGRLKEADDGFHWFVRYYNRQQPTDAETLILVAQGSAQYARWHGVSQIFNFAVNTLAPDALAADPGAWQATYLSGALLVEKYNRGQGVPELKKALTINPRSADVLATLAAAELQDYALETARDYADQALQINPRHVAALHIKADLAIQDDQLTQALDLLKQAADVNPVAQATLGRQAACYILQDGPPPDKPLAQALQNLDAIDEIKFDKPGRALQVIIDVARRNPHPGELLTTIAATLENRRKFELAEQFYKGAIAALPQLAEPKTALGMLYMRVGNTPEAQKLLDAAFKADPFHVRVNNMRKVAKLLDDYDTVTTEHFVIRVDKAADHILAEYMAEYLEEIYPELTRHFGYEPPTRTQFEIFHDAKGLSAHQWFSARMIGLPWIQTIGASTGMIVALASPTAGEQKYNWARVVKHEFVHILTLQQTQFNIPHWFTEALAVDAEGYPDPEVWRQLLRTRVPKNELMNLDNVNLGFIRPKTPLDWQMAYCQSHLYARYMMDTYGRESIAKMLDAYRRNLATPAALKEVCGVDKAAFEKGYLEYIRKYTATLGPSGETPTESATLAELEKAHLAAPDDAAAAAKYAHGLLQVKRLKDARGMAQKALDKSPQEPLAAVVMATLELRSEDFDSALKYLEPALDKTRPHPEVLELLAKIRLQQEQWDEAAALYELGREHDPGNLTWLKGLAVVDIQRDRRDSLKTTLQTLSERDADDVQIRKKLAQLQLEDKEYAAAVQSARRSLHIDVMDPELHEILGKALTALKQHEPAAKELGYAFELQPDSAAAQTAYAAALEAAGRKDEAAKVRKQPLAAPKKPGPL